VTFIPNRYCNSFSSAINALLKTLFQPQLDAPAGRRNGRFETKAADDLFENGVVLRMGHELRGDFDAPAVLKVVAVEPPQAKLAVPGALQQQGADMRLFRAPADHADTVM
jgi:hypothetical protein